MKWLQLSDLHIKDSADWEMMKEAYKRILSKKALDFVIVTGDLHNYSENYDETKKFLDEIISATKIDKKSLFLIPGNHDAKNFKLKEPCVEYILNHTHSSSECYRNYENDLMNSFKEYEEFYKNYFGLQDYKLKNVELHTWNEKINIIALNSSLISDGKNEHKQIVDTFNLSKVNIKNGLPTIAIGHHEISYFFEEHKTILQRVFTNLRVSAYLCGDLHKDSTQNITDFSSANKTIPSIVCGKSAIDNTDSYSDNSFIIYECNNESVVEVTVHLYKWNSEKKSFYESSDFDCDDGKFKFTLYDSGKKSNKGKNSLEKDSFKNFKKYDDILQLQGYVLIGPRGTNGIKYIWKKNEQIVESLAFNQRLGLPPSNDLNTSAYTVSISHGCILQTDNTQCVFCETGSEKFNGYLTAEDIALQNIFMAEYDSDCPSYPNVRNNSREFAYMGQGEPGHAYHLLRKSILLTDYAMTGLKQNVSRYIISTCGIDGFIPLLLNDIEKKVFKNKISIHFSLNAIGEDRNILMPINRNNRYDKFIKECELFYNYTKEKIAVSMIIFNDLHIKEKDFEFSYSLNNEILEKALELLNPQKFRIDLRDFNSNKLMQLKDVSNEYATSLLEKVTKKGFEGKICSCFGEDNEKAAFGMLNSDMSEISKPGNTTISHYRRAIELLREAQKNI